MQTIRDVILEQIKQRDEILEQIKQIEGIWNVSDHFCNFSNGSTYAASFITKNDKEFIKSLKPILDDITSVFGERINMTRGWRPKLLTHHHLPKFDSSKWVMLPPKKDVYVSYQVWLKPQDEEC